MLYLRRLLDPVTAKISPGCGRHGDRRGAPFRSTRPIFSDESSRSHLSLAGAPAFRHRRLKSYIDPVRRNILRKILGTVERGSSEPRRNTSKEIFESPGGGNRSGNIFPLRNHPSPLTKRLAAFGCGDIRAQIRRRPVFSLAACNSCRQTADFALSCPRIDDFAKADILIPSIPGLPLVHDGRSGWRLKLQPSASGRSLRSGSTSGGRSVWIVSQITEGRRFQYA